MADDTVFAIDGYERSGSKGKVDVIDTYRLLI
jgi:hypothetical protein